MTGVPRIVLASASPRRRELLELMGIEDFEVRPAGIDERAIPADHPRTYALRCAWQKARAVASALPEEHSSLILAADTVVAQGPVLFGKPENGADARRMLRKLSGTGHDVITGVALCRAGNDQPMVDSETTRIEFRELDDSEISVYIASGEPFDKAGAYGIQGGAGAFVSAITGDYYNVVGLPCALLARMLEEAAPGFSTRVPAPPPGF